MNGKDKETVVQVYADACCVGSWGAYQIRRTNPRPADIALLSSQHPTEQEAWKYAAVRVRREQEVRSNLEESKAIVLRTFPLAYCVPHASDHQIRRPRREFDEAECVGFVPLSGHYSVPGFAWKEAAKRIIDRQGFERDHY